MIYVLEIPHQMPPKAWAVEDEHALLAICTRLAEASGRTVFEKATVAELFECYGFGPQAKRNGPEAEEIESLGLFDLRDKYGLDGVVYRADYSREEGEYSPKPISILGACRDYITHDLHMGYVFENAAEAKAALKGGLAVHQGAKAEIALRNLLEEHGELCPARLRRPAPRP